MPLPDEQYRRILGINVFGVANTLRHFVPTMIAQEEPGIVVSTASLMGIVTGSGGERDRLFPSLGCAALL